jgi:4-cresol dehydrogenase (hydroxylating)
MQRIRQLDLERGVAVVEPGVSQGALADRLADTPFLLNVTTSCRDSSVIGNALDRGQGALRLRVDELLGVEAVLGNGSVVATGVLAPDGGGLFGRASGPDATPLFCQSNFGVVTAAAIALVRRPERTSYVYASYAGESLPAVVDCLARLRGERVADSIFYLGEMQLAPNAPGLPDFTLLGPLLGRTRLVAEALEIAREELVAVPGCKTMRTGEADALAPGDPLYHRGRNFLGIPSCEPLRKRFGTTTCELDTTSRTGWSVVQTLVPFDGQAIGDALSVLKAGVDVWGVPVHPHISSVTPTALNLMTMIWFQRTPEHIARMRGLRDELQTKLVERGYPHSRAGIDMLRRAMPGGSRDEAWAQIKAAFDPNGIIAPGRYVIGSGARSSGGASASTGAGASAPRDGAARSPVFDGLTAQVR